MTGVEIVGTAPALETPEPARERVQERAKWSRDELDLTLTSASGHIRYLLWELSQAPEVAARDLKSKPVAYAQVQRVCNSRGKEALVVAFERGGDRIYSLHPGVRDDVASLVSGALPPPPSEPKPASERKPRRNRRGMSALDGIATVGGPAPAAASAPAPARRISQTQSGRTLSIPPEISIDFCKELLGFVNATAGGTRYRIVLEDDGYRLEAC
jgi:hypothetical protein